MNEERKPGSSKDQPGASDFAGILTEQGGNWFFKRNVSNLPRDTNGQIVLEDSTDTGTVTANFEPVQTIAPKPSQADLSFGRQQLLDLAGDGRKCLVQYDEPVSGFYEEKKRRGWQDFT